MTTSAEMPRYKCHKIVHALQIKEIARNVHHDGVQLQFDGFAPIQYRGPGEPEVGGYYVVYEGGYASYSPAKAFEEGYTRLDT